MLARFSHNWPIYKHDHISVYMNIEKAARGIIVEWPDEAFYRRKDVRRLFIALILGHASDTKYREILKKRMNLLQNIRCNGGYYPLGTHVYNNCQEVEGLWECDTHITNSVLDQAQWVEYLIGIILCSDNTLQATIGLLHANTNNMGHNFEAAASTLIEFTPKRGLRDFHLALFWKPIYLYLTSATVGAHME